MDFTEVRETVQELLDTLKAIEELPAPTADAPRQMRNLHAAKTTRELLYAAHLGDRIAVDVMDVYHDFKSADDPPRVNSSTARRNRSTRSL
jgi:hypothetical protein